MKNLIFINGTMGAGKTSVCTELLQMLPKAVFLDGDWCWNMHPFVVTDETKEMVVGNIAHLLGSFLRCSEYQNILFCWVMHEQSIVDSILARVDMSQANYRLFTLTLSESALRERLARDIAAGKRDEDILNRSCARLGLYGRMYGTRIDVSSISARAAALQIADMIPPCGSGTRIEPVTAKNAALASQIYARAWKVAYRGVAPDAYLDALSLDRWTPILANSNYEGYLMLDAGMPVATSSIAAARDPEKTGWGEIISMYVSPGAFRRGCGRALMEFDLNRLRERGFKRTYLWVLEENPQARAFYEAMGFAPTEDRVTAEIGGKTVVEMRYIRRL